MRVYGVMISFNNGAEKFKFPINPSEITISEATDGQTYDVVGLGEINVIKDRKLTEYSFSGLFPAQFYPFITLFEGLTVEEDEKDPIRLEAPVMYIKRIEKWMTTRKPVRFVFISDTYDINTPASIESFEWKEVAGSGGDIEFSITLKKYIFYAARKIEQTISGNGTVKQVMSSPPRPNEKQQPKTYKMVPGDSLWKVAQVQLGNGARWKEIQKLNGISDAEVDRLPIGKVLKLPS